MTWQRQRNSCVLRFGDGSDTFPRIVVFPVSDDPRSPWAATVHDRPERSYWPSQNYGSVIDAERGALEYARCILPREWHPTIDAALDALDLSASRTA
jgi:hypothetical protein